MKLIKTPTKGMNDYLPAEVALREYVKSVIVNSYAADGFCMIETPAVEHIENLTGKNGGENEKLIFKIMKRGEKLASASSEDELCDSGLRYDLTVPLSRYYSNNSAKLPFVDNSHNHIILRPIVTQRQWHMYWAGSFICIEPCHCSPARCFLLHVGRYSVSVNALVFERPQHHIRDTIALLLRD